MNWICKNCNVVVSSLSCPICHRTKPSPTPNFNPDLDLASLHALHPELKSTEAFIAYENSLPKPLDPRPYYQRDGVIKENIWKDQNEFLPVPTEASTEQLWRIVASREKKCEGCGVTSQLEVHHIKPRRDGGSNEPKNLKILCQACHGKEDPYRRKFLSKLRYRLSLG